MNLALERLTRGFQLDSRSLLLFRVGLSLLLFLEIFICARDLSAHYSETGVLTAESARSLHEFSPLVWKFFFLFHLSGEPFAQGLILGIFSVVVFLLLVGYHANLACLVSWFFLRSLQARNPLLFNAGDTVLGILTLWGAVLPIGAHAGFGKKTEPSGPRVFLSWVTVGYLTQLCVLYWGAAILKTGPEWRQDFTAVSYALASPQTGGSGAAFLIPFSRTCRFLTVAVLAFEIVGPCLLLVPWRRESGRSLCILAFLTIHFGFAFFLNLGVFPLVSFVALLPLLPGEWVNRIFPSDRARHLETSERSSNQVFGFCLTVLLIQGIWTLDTSLPKRVLATKLTNPAGQIVPLLNVVNRWKMFAPSPEKTFLSYHIQGETRDGTRVSLSHDGKKELSSSSTIAVQEGDHWGVFLMNLARLDGASLPLLSYENYLCGEWNAHHSPAAKLKEVRLWVFETAIQPDYVAGASRRRELGTYPCDEIRLN